MKAVHFGAGNIGRGFVGLLLQQGGYEVVFADVSQELVAALNTHESYTVTEVGPGGHQHRVAGFRAINSATQAQDLIADIATAEVATTAVGPRVLPLLAATIVDGLRARDPQASPIQIMACENAVGASDTLAAAMAKEAGADWEQLSARAVFANTAVDRIIPEQSGVFTQPGSADAVSDVDRKSAAEPGASASGAASEADSGTELPGGVSIDVLVEPFYEWVIERSAFGTDLPRIPGAHFVAELTPYIERKLYTVNTGHAAAAYFGAQKGHTWISDALSDGDVTQAVEAVLEETSALLCTVHGFSTQDMSHYRATTLERFRNPELPDTVTRVGREPLRKLSAGERFLGPAVQALGHGLPIMALNEAIQAALHFRGEDAQAMQLKHLLQELSPEQFTAEVSLLEVDEPFFTVMVDLVAQVQGEL